MDILNAVNKEVVVKILLKMAIRVFKFSKINMSISFECPKKLTTYRVVSLQNATQKRLPILLLCFSRIHFYIEFWSKSTKKFVYGLIKRVYLLQRMDIRWKMKAISKYIKKNSILTQTAHIFEYNFLISHTIFIFWSLFERSFNGFQWSIIKKPLSIK